MSDKMNFFKKNLFKSMYFKPVSYLAAKILNKYSKPYKSVIFVASTGRSGTGTLHKIFESLGHVKAYHEPRPIMHAKLMIDKNNGDDTEAKKTFYDIKTNMIALENLSGKYDHYMEANHMFIKSFYEYAYDYFKDKLKVVYLKRDPLLVAKSMYELDTIPGKNKLGNKWYLDYKGKNNIIKIESKLDNELTHDYYKCLWYCYEIEARVIKMKDELKDLEVIDIDISDLNDLEKVEELLSKLDVEFDNDKLKNVVGLKHNKKVESKIRPIDLSECKEMHSRFLEFLGNR